jgi:phenylpropionate dioxygenase-like ring-hydroxylating dioxygenase large terminal subunit
MTLRAAAVAAFTLPGLLYPVLYSNQLGSQPVQVYFAGNVLALYRDSCDKVVAHTDICPHQGASFAKAGHVTSQGELVCGYHGFKFCKGKFLGLSGVHKNKSGYQMPLWDTTEKDGMICMKMLGSRVLNTHADGARVDMHLPETSDAAYQKVWGCRTIRQDHQVVTENVLDMMHVSYVHRTFGNRASPLPTNLKYESLGDYAGRSTFTYRPRPGSLASFLGSPFPEVLVENEFHLPSTTVTRVITGKFVKTVVTRALPQENGSTKLFWEVYRNFARDSWGVGDACMAYLMDKTLDEDVQILKNVDPKHRQGPIQVKYDVTIRKYRQAITSWMHRTLS